MVYYFQKFFCHYNILPTRISNWDKLSKVYLILSWVANYFPMLVNFHYNVTTVVKVYLHSDGVLRWRWLIKFHPQTETPAGERLSQVSAAAGLSVEVPTAEQRLPSWSQASEPTTGHPAVHYTQSRRYNSSFVNVVLFEGLCPQDSCEF